MRKKRTMKYFTVLFYGVVACALIFFVEYTIVNDPKRIIFNDQKMYINPGETVKVPYRTTLTSGNKIETTWTSSNPDVATVSEDGTIRGYKEGSAKITLKVKSDGVTKKSSIEVHTTLNTISVQSVKVSKENLILNAGDTYTLKAILSPRNATNQKVYFTSSDPSVALADSNGNIRALKEGRATITLVTDDGKFKDICKVIVSNKEVPATHITLKENENTITVGEDFTIDSTVYPTNATNKSIMYKSSDDSIASVDEYGNVVGKRPGTVTITATSSSGMHQDVTKVHVREKVEEKPKEVEVEEVLLKDSKIDLEVGDTYRVDASLKPKSSTNTKLIYRVSNEKILSITEDGKLRALQKGEATVVVTAHNGINASFKVKVTEKEIPLKDFSLVQNRYEIEEGESFTLPITLEPLDTNQLNFTYKVQDEQILSVKEGIVKGLKKGKSTITILGENHKKVVCTVEVVAPKKDTLEKIETEAYVKMKVGELYTLIPKLEPDMDEELFYYTSDEKVVSVDENGHIMAHKEGYSTITVLSLNGKKSVTKVLVQKEEEPISSIKFSKEKNKITLGDVKSLKYQILPKSAKTSVTFSSSNEEVVLVTKDGEILAKKVGTSIITVKTENGKFDTCIIEVVPKDIPVEKVSFKEQEMTVDMGDYKNIKTSIFPLDATEQSVKYESSDESVASISSSGRVTAHKEGKTTITVKSFNGKMDTMTVTVQKKIIKATGIAFDSDVLYMSLGDEKASSVTLSPLGVENPKITYQVVDSNVASVDEMGHIKAQSVGTTYITSSIEGKKARMKVVVSADKVLPTKLVMKSSELMLGVGKKERAQTSLLPVETTERNIKFSSQNEEIATIDEKGMVTGRKPGTTFITATTENGIISRMKVQVVDYVSQIHFLEEGMLLIESNGLYGLIDLYGENTSESGLISYLKSHSIAHLSFIVSDKVPSYLKKLEVEKFIDDQTLSYIEESTSLSKEETVTLGDFMITLYRENEKVHVLVKRGSEKVLLTNFINDTSLLSKIGKVDLLIGQASKMNISTLQELKPSYMVLQKETGDATVPLYYLKTIGSKIYSFIPMRIKVLNNRLTLPKEIEIYQNKVADGFHISGDDLYSFQNGSPLTGFQKLLWKDKNVYFYFDENGKRVTGFQTIPWTGGKDTFYFDAEGVMQKGFLEIDGKKYYFDENGAMVKNACTILNRKKYCFSPLGICIEGKGCK